MVIYYWEYGQLIFRIHYCIFQLPWSCITFIIHERTNTFLFNNKKSGLGHLIVFPGLRCFGGNYFILPLIPQIYLISQFLLLRINYIGTVTLLKP